MHELGIVTYVADAIDQVAEEEGIEKVLSVTLEIGEVSGVVPEYLVDAWAYFSRKHPLLKESELRWEPLEAITLCDDCNRTYRTIEHGRICPYCGSENTFLLRGREMNIKEIEAI